MDFHQLLHTFVGEKVQVRFMMLKEISENVYGLFLKIGEVKCRTKVFSGGEQYQTAARFYCFSAMKEMR